MKMKAAIFDMDGTLIDSLIFWDFLWTTLGERYLGYGSFRPRKEDDKKVRTMILSDAMDLIHDGYGFGESGEELLQMTNGLLYDFYENRVEMKPGVREFLDHCLEQGVKMCVASATDGEFLKLAIKRCGLEKYFLRVFSCSSIGKGKEEPDIFLMAQEFLGSGREETWVFEDSLTAIRTADSVGMPTVGIYDACNFGQEEIRAIAKFYIAEGESLMKLVP